MKSTEIAVIKTSPKNGYARMLHVWEVRDDGWVKGDFHSEIPRPNKGMWVAPHNILTIEKKTGGWDYNGIKEGTLVNFLNGQVGLVVARLGAHYRVMDSSSGEVRHVPWEEVVPVETTQEVTNETR